MRMLTLIKRIMKQVIRDKRTMALLFIAPIFVITILNYIFPDTDDDITITAVNVNASVIEHLEKNNIKVKTSHGINIENYLIEGHAAAVLEETDGEFNLTVLNDNPIEEGPAVQALSQAVMETQLNELTGDIDEMTTQLDEVLTQINEVLNDMPPEMNSSLDIDTEVDMPDHFETENISMEDAVTVQYIYGDENYTFFEILNPVLISFFVFFFVFLIAGMSMLKERSSGTLEKLLSTPVKRSEIVLGYLLGYGIFAIIQTAVIIIYSIYILDMEIAGSIVHMFIINILLSFTALGLGLLLSTFVNSEFQMMQFIPLVIIPQIFFSGMLKVESMETWLQWIAPFMPLYYAGNAMIDVVLKGYTFSEIITPLLFLIGFIIIFVTLNILGMKRYRKV